MLRNAGLLPRFRVLTLRQQQPRGKAAAEAAGRGFACGGQWLRSCVRRACLAAVGVGVLILAVLIRVAECQSTLMPCIRLIFVRLGVTDFIFFVIFVVLLAFCFHSLQQLLWKLLILLARVCIENALHICFDTCLLIYTGAEYLPAHTYSSLIVNIWVPRSWLFFDARQLH